MVSENPLKFTIRKIHLGKQIPTKSIALIPASNEAASAISDDPQLFLQRTLSLASSDSINITLAECLEFELYPVSLALFEPAGFMRVSQKSGLAQYLITERSLVDSVEGTRLLKSGQVAIVIDGGALLHRVGWTTKETFASIIANYHAHLHNMFGNSKVLVVFDEYLESSTKNHCHLKRSPIQSLPIDFEDTNKVLLCKKQVFLSNTVNQQNFVNKLSSSLKSDAAGYSVSLSSGDADLDIVQNAMEAVKKQDDTDLLVLAMH